MSIKVGDLVMVTKPSLCCGSTRRVGTVFMVDAIANQISTCRHCGDMSNPIYASGEAGNFDVARLIKIDPPSLPESLEREKELSV